MSKTNHQRGFKAGSNGKVKRTVRVLRGRGLKDVSEFADVAICAKYPGVRHDRGNKLSIAGAKKFVRSRIRFHERAKLREIQDQVDEG